jgi:hypothetical protein
MKQSEPSNATVQTDSEFSKRRERISKSEHRTMHYRKLMRGIIAVLCIALVVTLYVLAHSSFSDHVTTSNAVQSSTVRSLEVEVLDGAGSMKATQYMRSVLQEQGYDVVEMKRNNDGVVERTFVLDRSGNLEAARQLATNLGISQDKVFQKIDRNLYIDVTVMVGKDFSKLKAFQLFTERSNH